MPPFSHRWLFCDYTLKIKLTYKEIGGHLEQEGPGFPTYSAPLLNLANRFAQGTRPRVVGQMTELFQAFPGITLGEWETWYQQRHPKGIENATEKVWSMLKNLRDAIGQIDRNLVERWVEDLTLRKTFYGLRIQKAILKKIAEVRNTTYRLAKPKEESRGIDGYIGDKPISIKPRTYETMEALTENIEARIILYEATEGGIVFELPSNL